MDKKEITEAIVGNFEQYQYGNLSMEEVENSIEGMLDQLLKAERERCANECDALFKIVMLEIQSDVVSVEWVRRVRKLVNCTIKKEEYK